MVHDPSPHHGQGAHPPALALPLPLVRGVALVRLSKTTNVGLLKGLTPSPHEHPLTWLGGPSPGGRPCFRLTALCRTITALFFLTVR